MKGVETFLNKEIPDGSKLVLACSGGPDSMCLLSLLHNISITKNLTIIVAHVNHLLRSSSTKEEEFLKEYCTQRNLIFESTRLKELQGKKVSEGLARNKRYEFLKKIVEKYQASFLLTAHHGNDLIETILMRITRGSNLKGYMGIEQVSQNDHFTILRPLLTITKEDILNYNKKNNIPYVIDESNEDLRITRNRYRKIILPFLQEEEPKINQKYFEFSEELKDYYDFVNNYIIEKELIVDKKIVINKVLKEPDFIKIKTVELLIRDIQKYDLLDVNKKNIKDILKIIKNGHNKSIDLNNSYKAVLEYDYLMIKKDNSDNEDYTYILDDSVAKDDWQISIVNQSASNSNYEILLNSEELKLPLLIKNNMNQEQMAVKNMSGHKKVIDILKDAKVSKTKRTSYPILIDSAGNIIWIPGLKKSQFAKDKNEKYDIILKYEVKSI